MDGEQNQTSKGVTQSFSAEPNVIEKQESTPSSLEQFEKIVDRAHKEIEGVRNVYIWLAGILGIILATGIGLATYLTYNNARDMR